MRTIALLLLSGGCLFAAGPELFPIRDGRKLGFIDKSGKVVVSPQFDSVGEFSDGMARVSLGSESGYIDATGRVRVRPQYQNAREFQDGRAIVMTEDKYLLIDRDGKTIATIPYRPMGEFHSGLCRVQRARTKDADGKTIQTAYGYINRDGGIAIEPQFINASDFDDDGGLAVVIKGDQWLYIDRKARTVLSLPIEGHDRVDSFHDGLLRWKEDGWWGYKATSGQWVVKPQYDTASNFEHGMGIAQLKGKLTFLDRKGKPVDRPKYRQVAAYAEDLAVVNEGGRLGYVGRNKEYAFEVPMLEEAHSFSNGLARVKMDGKFGYLDHSGKFVIKPLLSSAADFRGGLAWVAFADGSMGYMDVRGEKVWAIATAGGKRF